MNETFDPFPTSSESEIEEIVHGSSSSDNNHYYDDEEETITEEYESLSADDGDYLEETYHSSPDQPPKRSFHSNNATSNSYNNSMSAKTGSSDSAFPSLDEVAESDSGEEFVEEIFEEDQSSMASNSIVSENDNSSVQDIRDVGQSDRKSRAKYDADVDGSSHQSSSASSYSAGLKDNSERRFYQPPKQSPPKRIIQTEEGSLGISSTSFRSSSYADGKAFIGDTSINSKIQTPSTPSTLGFMMNPISESERSNRSEASEMHTNPHDRTLAPTNNNRRGKKTQKRVSDFDVSVGSTDFVSFDLSQDVEPNTPSSTKKEISLPRSKTKKSRPKSEKQRRQQREPRPVQNARTAPFDDNTNVSADGRCPSIAVLGTVSGTGKSVIAAALCRIFANGGTRCAPFKSQNTGSGTSPALLPEVSRRDAMYDSLSAMVEDEGYQNGNSGLVVSPTKEQSYGQIGMAQALQAEACRIVPRVEMNPIFFQHRGTNEKKEAMCDMMVMGKQIVRETYGNISRMVPTMQSMVLDSHWSLASVTDAEVIVIQGAGSCSELNLMDGDIVNLPLMRCLQCPWFLVANDEIGGVFAQVMGTKMCVTKRDWALCKGIIVNKVRGNVKGFLRGLKLLKKMTRKPLYAMPFIDDLKGPNGEAIDVEKRLLWEKQGRNHNDRQYEAIKSNRATRSKPSVVVVAYPHTITSNELYPLERDARFQLEWRRKRLPKPYPDTTAVILPDSRIPMLDLKWLQDSGWTEFIRKHVSAGGAVLGLGAGYQMLGWEMRRESEFRLGIGLLPISSIVQPAECNRTVPTKGQLYPSGIDIEGVEVNSGFSEVAASEKRSVAEGRYEGLSPLIAYEDGKPEGMRLGHVHGTYVQGILRSAKARVELLVPTLDRKEFHSILEESTAEDALDKFANHLESCGLDYYTLQEMVFDETSNGNR